MDALGAVDALELALSVVVALEGLGLLVVKIGRASCRERV